MLMMNKSKKLTLWIASAVLAACFQPDSGRYGFKAARAETAVQSDSGTDQQPEKNQGTLTLNEVTWLDKIRWSAQAIVAPEGLHGVIPIYAYSPTENLDMKNATKVCKVTDGQETSWVAEHNTDIPINSNCSVASDYPIPGIQETVKLWTHENKWQGFMGSKL